MKDTLVQLPNGQYTLLSTITTLCAEMSVPSYVMGNPDIPHRVLVYTTNGVHCHPCETYKEACHWRDDLALQVRNYLRQQQTGTDPGDQHKDA